jgi:hemerythrin superfamily protein
MPNGIDLIVADHEMVNQLFADFDDTHDGATIGLVIAALEAHDQAEQAALYPMAGTLLDDLELIQRSETAHSMIKKQFDVIANLEGPPLAAAFQVLQELVTAHADDEEKNLLPALAEVATPQQLEALGARFLQAKQRGG